VAKETARKSKQPLAGTNVEFYEKSVRVAIKLMGDNRQLPELASVSPALSAANN
jgi:hypothetical protein